MKTLSLIHLEIILHYITLTNYYIVKDTFRSQVITAMLMWKQKNNRLNKMTTLSLIHLEIILYYITLTGYYIVKDTFRSQVITAM